VFGCVTKYDASNKDKKFSLEHFCSWVPLMIVGLQFEKELQLHG